MKGCNHFDTTEKIEKLGCLRRRRNTGILQSENSEQTRDADNPLLNVPVPPFAIIRKYYTPTAYHCVT